MSVSLSSLPPAVVEILLAAPAGSPPPGVVAHLGSRNPHLTSVIVETSITHAIAVIAVIIRLYTHHFISKGLLLEDYVIIIATLVHTVTDAFGIYCVALGTGQHMWNMSLQNFITLSSKVYFFGIFYLLSLTFIKSAILLQFIRIFTPNRINKPVWIICWACIIINIVFYTINIMLSILQCIPVQKQWDPFVEGHCVSLFDVYKAGGLFNMISDFTILLIPIPIILRLNMSSRKKLAVTAFFATGTLACASSIMRFYYTVRTFKSSDPSYYEWFEGLWCSIEQSAGIVIFCLPTLPQFYRFIREKTGKPAPIQVEPDVQPEPMEVAKPRPVRNPYSMPSLASFEERQAQKKTAAVHISTLEEAENGSSDSLKPCSSE